MGIGRPVQKCETRCAPTPSRSGVPELSRLRRYFPPLGRLRHGPRRYRGWRRKRKTGLIRATVRTARALIRHRALPRLLQTVVPGFSPRRRDVAACAAPRLRDRGETEAGIQRVRHTGRRAVDRFAGAIGVAIITPL
jgi:hypothetical protein